MAEEIREIVLTIMVDTNKQTVQRTFLLDSLDESDVMEAVNAVKGQFDG